MLFNLLAFITKKFNRCIIQKLTTDNMAFYGVTYHGLQNVFRGLSSCPEVTPISIFESGQYREKDYLKYYEMCDLYPLLYRHHALIPEHSIDQNDCCRTKSHDEFNRLKKTHSTGLGKTFSLYRYFMQKHPAVHIRMSFQLFSRVWS